MEEGTCYLSKRPNENGLVYSAYFFAPGFAMVHSTFYSQVELAAPSSLVYFRTELPQ